MNKIAFVSTNKSAWGGSEYLWYNSSFRFKASGYDVIASVPRWNDLPSSIESLKSKGIKVYFNTDIPSYKNYITDLRRDQFSINTKTTDSGFFWISNLTS
ncbi:MAG: hypothetical protein IPI04_06710 [Ignavibacteria bacterium]|nr:hypothetical protein [Ignavibacteria bacterium]